MKIMNKRTGKMFDYHRGEYTPIEDKIEKAEDVPEEESEDKVVEEEPEVEKIEEE